MLKKKVYYFVAAAFIIFLLLMIYLTTSGNRYSGIAQKNSELPIKSAGFANLPFTSSIYYYGFVTSRGETYILSGSTDVVLLRSWCLDHGLDYSDVGGNTNNKLINSIARDLTNTTNESSLVITSFSEHDPSFYGELDGEYVVNGSIDSNDNSMIVVLRKVSQD